MYAAGEGSYVMFLLNVSYAGAFFQLIIGLMGVFAQSRKGVRTRSLFLHCLCIYRMSQEERSIFWDVIVSAILTKAMFMYMCPIPNGLRDRANGLRNV
jgi:hypothetical protein